MRKEYNDKGPFKAFLGGFVVLLFEIQFTELVPSENEGGVELDGSDESVLCGGVIIEQVENSTA